MTPPRATAYSNDSDVSAASRTISTQRGTGGAPGYPPVSLRSSGTASAAKPTSAPASTIAACRPPGSTFHDHAEISTASADPMVNTPSASPRRPYPTVRATSVAPTTNAVPAAPATAPAATMTGTEPASPSPITDPAATRLTAGNIVRAPYRSVSTPTGRRNTPATSSGTPRSIRYSPNRTSLRWASSGPSRIHARRFSASPIVATTSSAAVRSDREPGTAGST